MRWSFICQWIRLAVLFHHQLHRRCYPGFQERRRHPEKDGRKVCSVCVKISCEVPSAEFNGIIVGDSVSGELEGKLRHLKKNGRYPLLANKLMWKKKVFSQSWSTGPNVSIVEETPIYNWICPRICPPTSYFHVFPMIRSQVWCMCWVCVCVCLCVVFLPLSVGVCQAAVTELRGK